MYLGKLAGILTSLISSPGNYQSTNNKRLQQWLVVDETCPKLGETENSYRSAAMRSNVRHKVKVASTYSNICAENVVSIVENSDIPFGGLESCHFTQGSENWSQKKYVNIPSGKYIYVHKYVYICVYTYLCKMDEYRYYAGLS